MIILITVSLQSAFAQPGIKTPIEKMTLITIGEPGGQVVKNIKSQLESKFSVPITIGEKFELGAQAKNELKSSGQFAVDAFLNDWKMPIPEKTMYLVISQYGIFAKGANFLFSAAHPSKAVVVVSIAKFFDPSIEQQNQISQALKKGGKPFDLKQYAGEAKKVVELRTVKTLLRTMGAVLGLDAGANAECVMKFSNTLQELDSKSSDYCGKDLAKLKAAKLSR